MTKEPNEMQQAVSRTLRDSLGKLQRTADEINHAVADLVSACASSRPANSLSPILRAQTAAASLDASLEVLARFVTSSLQLATMPLAEELSAASQQTAAQPALPESVQSPVGLHIVETPAEPAVLATTQAAPFAAPVVAPAVTPAPEPILAPEPPQALREPSPSPLETIAPMAASDVLEVSGSGTGNSTASGDYEGNRPSLGAEFYPEPYSENGTENFKVELKSSAASQKPSFLDPPSTPDVPSLSDLASRVDTSSLVDTFEPTAAATESAPAVPAFNLSGLPPEEQELHRRANRVAKVSMQDIKMLRPNDVAIGRKEHDLCWRLRDDLEKAHREYDRRFQTIMVHPVDYFYDWLVEILADGDPQAIGEYPYPSPVLRH